MRLLVACVLVALAASSAHGFKYTKERKGDAVSCNTPISRVACKVDPDGDVIGLWFSAWGTPPEVDGFVPYIVDGDIAFTNNWCNEWGFRGRCTTGVPSSSQIIDFGGASQVSPGSDTEFAQWDIPYLTSMEVCYGHKKTIKGIKFTAQNFETQWVLVDGKPVATVAPGDTSEETCGTFDDDTKCLFRQTFTAPEGQVLGSFGGKCKYSQGWFKYVSNGQYKERYTLEKIEKACVTDPVPPPIGLFEICDACEGDPNVDTCPDYTTYQCGGCEAAKKKK